MMTLLLHACPFDLSALPCYRFGWRTPPRGTTKKCSFFGDLAAKNVPAFMQKIISHLFKQIVNLQSSLPPTNGNYLVNSQEKN
jgi:hypothetical protein